MIFFDMEVDPFDREVTIPDDLADMPPPCTGRRPDDGQRCGSPLSEDGTCSECGTQRCEICSRVVPLLGFDFCEDACRRCVAREELPVGMSPSYAWDRGLLPMVVAFT